MTVGQLSNFCQAFDKAKIREWNQGSLSAALGIRRFWSGQKRLIFYDRAKPLLSSSCLRPSFGLNGKKGHAISALTTVPLARRQIPRRGG
jgi:hypothetical protein